MKTKESSTVKKSGFDYNYTPPPTKATWATKPTWAAKPTWATKPAWATKPPQTNYKGNNNQSEFLV